MICPQTDKKCRAFTCLRINGCGKLAGLFSNPPPTLAEIERLVDAYGVAGGGAENKAALMAAIRAYGRE